MREANKFLTAVFMAAASAASVFAFPSMPDGFRCLFRDDSGKTWRETGEFAMPQDATLAAIRKAMKAQGYAERFDIGGEEGADPDSGHVLLWTKGDEEIIVSLWIKSANQTGCSWGVSPKAPPAAPPSGGKPLPPEEGTTTKKEKTKDGQQH